MAGIEIICLSSDDEEGEIEPHQQLPDAEASPRIQEVFIGADPTSTAEEVDPLHIEDSVETGDDGSCSNHFTSSDSLGIPEVFRIEEEINSQVRFDDDGSQGFTHTEVDPERFETILLPELKLSPKPVLLDETPDIQTGPVLEAPSSNLNVEASSVECSNHLNVQSTISSVGEDIENTQRSPDKLWKLKLLAEQLSTSLKVDQPTDIPTTSVAQEPVRKKRGRPLKNGHALKNPPKKKRVSRDNTEDENSSKFCISIEETVKTERRGTTIRDYSSMFEDCDTINSEYMHFMSNTALAQLEKDICDKDITLDPKQTTLSSCEETSLNVSRGQFSKPAEGFDFNMGSKDSRKLCKGYQNKNKTRNSSDNTNIVTNQKVSSINSCAKTANLCEPVLPSITRHAESQRRCSTSRNGDQEKINKLRFTFNRSSGDLSVSVVPQSQVSPENRNYIVNTEETLATDETPQKNIIGEGLPHNVSEENVELHQHGTQSKEIQSVQRNGEISEHKTIFLQCYRQVFDDEGESCCVRIGKMVLVTMKARKDVDTFEPKNNAAQTQAHLQVQQRYFELCNRIKPKFGTLFKSLCNKIFQVSNRDQHTWMLITWFVKVYLYVGAECEDYAEKLHELKKGVLNFVPKFTNLTEARLVTESFCMTEVDFETKCWQVLEYMKDCCDSENASSPEPNSIEESSANSSSPHLVAACNSDNPVENSINLEQSKEPGNCNLIPGGDNTAPAPLRMAEECSNLPLGEPTAEVEGSITGPVETSPGCSISESFSIRVISPLRINQNYELTEENRPLPSFNRAFPSTTDGNAPNSNKSSTENPNHPRQASVLQKLVEATVERFYTGPPTTDASSENSNVQNHKTPYFYDSLRTENPNHPRQASLLQNLVEATVESIYTGPPVTDASSEHSNIQDQETPYLPSNINPSNQAPSTIQRPNMTTTEAMNQHHANESASLQQRHALNNHPLNKQSFHQPNVSAAGATISPLEQPYLKYLLLAPASRNLRDNNARVQQKIASVQPQPSTAIFNQSRQLSNTSEDYRTTVPNANGNVSSFPTNNERASTQRILNQNQVPAQQHQLTGQRNQLPVHQHQFPVHQNQFPGHQNHFPVHQNQLPIYQNQFPVHQNQFPVYPNQFPVHQNQFPVHQNRFPVFQNQHPVYQNKHPVHQNQLPVHHNQRPVHQNQPSSYQRQTGPYQAAQYVQTHPRILNQNQVLAQHQLPVQRNQLPVNQYQVPVHQTQLPVNQYQVPVHQTQLPVNQYQVPVHQNQLPVNQNQMLVHQNQPPSTDHQNKKKRRRWRRKRRKPLIDRKEL